VRRSASVRPKGGKSQRRPRPSGCLRFTEADVLDLLRREGVPLHSGEETSITQSLTRREGTSTADAAVPGRFAETAVPVLWSARSLSRRFHVSRGLLYRLYHAGRLRGFWIFRNIQDEPAQRELRTA